MVAFNNFGQGYFVFEAEFEKSSGSMTTSKVQSKLPVAKHLNDKENNILIDTYMRHNRSMGLETRLKYSISNIVKVKVKVSNEIIEVYYDNGDWWHYTASGEWY